MNENRQVLAVNDLFVKKLGVDDPGETLGLRPGEAMQCVHAKGDPAGCAVPPNISQIAVLPSQ